MKVKNPLSSQWLWPIILAPLEVPPPLSRMKHFVTSSKSEVKQYLSKLIAFSYKHAMFVLLIWFPKMPTFQFDTYNKTPLINAQCRSMPVNVSQCRSMIWFSPVFYWCLDPALIGIERHFGSMPWFWSALIGIGHWLRESCYTMLVSNIPRIMVHL